MEGKLVPTLYYLICEKVCEVLSCQLSDLDSDSMSDFDEISLDCVSLPFQSRSRLQYFQQDEVKHVNIKHE